MNRSLCHLVAALACVLASVAASPAHAARASKAKSCANASLLPDAGNLAKVNKATLCLVNKERTKRGLQPLKRQAALSKAATGFARHMVAASFFDHTTPNGATVLDRIKATSYLKGRLQRWWVGENIAYGTGALGTPGSIVKAWMKSSGHRANILQRRFRDIGLGVSLGSPNGPTGATYVHDFGRRDR
jgi:uncharacterized protein YkwD